MKIGQRLPTFCHLALGGPVIMIHHVFYRFCYGLHIKYCNLSVFDCSIVSVYN